VKHFFVKATDLIAIGIAMLGWLWLFAWIAIQAISSCSSTCAMTQAARKMG
jgi:hypothetical protein